jgi:hypothetical protein
MIRRSRRDILGLGLSVAASSLVRQSDAQAAPPGRLRIRRGVNTWPWFSLTREYPAPRTDYPWPPLQEQRPSPRRADLRRLRAAGFDFIRIPVDPGPFLAGPESARAKLDNMLYDAIGEAIAVDLSVIVNVQANDATHYWNSSHMVASLAALAPLLYTFHFYEPYLFSHQGAPWMREPVYRSLNAVPWSASAGSLETTLAAVRARMAKDGETSASDKAAAYRETERVLTEYFAAQPDIGFAKQYFSKVRQWSEKNDVPMTEILLGEFGALRSDARYVAAGAADCARYIRDVRETAEDFGLPWAFWNLFDGMGIMDDSSRALDPAIVASLGLTMPAE